MKTLLLFLALFCAASLVSAQTARVMRLTGAKAASVLLPGAEAEVALAEGQEVPVGSLIVVGEGTKLFLKTFEGTITTAEPGTVFEILEVAVTEEAKERTRLALRNGDLVANLDPAKRGLHDYGVRTPKGVAAARGTNFSVTVAGVTVLVTVSAGEVTIQLPDMSAPISLSPGQSSTDGSGATSLAAALMNPATAAMARIAMQATASAVATLAADPTSGVTAATVAQVITTAGEAATATGDNSVVAASAAAAAQANPALANVVVTAAVTSAQGAATSIVASVARSVAATSSQSVAATVQSLAQTANTASGGQVTINTDQVTEAVQQSIDQGTTTPEVADPTAPPAPPADVPTLPEETVEIEIPVDNVIVSPSA